MSDNQKVVPRTDHENIIVKNNCRISLKIKVPEYKLAAKEKMENTAILSIPSNLTYLHSKLSRWTYVGTDKYLKLLVNRNGKLQSFKCEKINIKNAYSKWNNKRLVKFA